MHRNPEVEFAGCWWDANLLPTLRHMPKIFHRLAVDKRSRSAVHAGQSQQAGKERVPHGSSKGERSKVGVSRSRGRRLRSY